MRNLLSIVQTACAELGLSQPTSVVGNTDGQAVQFLALANREGSELAQIEGGWEVLRGEHLITMSPGVDNYAFPSDYQYYVGQTQWNRSNHWRLDGPMSAVDWQVLKSGLFPSGIYMRYRIMQGRIYFDPVPTDNSTIAIEYVSSNWAASAGGGSKGAFTADTDVPLLPDDLFVLGLKWRYNAAKGFDASIEKEAYDRALMRLHPRDTVVETIPLDRRGGGWLNYGLLPSGNWPGR